MSYELRYSPAATATLDRLEADPRMAKTVDAIDDLLDRLEDDPFDRRLGTASFQVTHQEGVCATSVRHEGWYVIWERGVEKGTLWIIEVAQLPD
jgi:hypothetical protein